MSDIKEPRVRPTSRCKICLLFYDNPETYNVHIYSYPDEIAYARHVTDRPPVLLDPIAKPAESET